LTLWQPWAHAVAHMGKRIENRDWTPPVWLVGQRFAIHAGLHFDQSAAELLGVSRDQVAFGAVVATAVYAGYVESEAQLPQGQEEWWSGPSAWVLDGVRTLREPLACRGWPGLWYLPLGVERRIREAGG
jgi:hypothetical protein